MSKWRQINKTLQRKIHKDPVKRLAKITELKRNIKFLKDSVLGRKKAMVNARNTARFAEYDYNRLINDIKKYEAELTELTKQESEI